MSCFICQPSPLPLLTSLLSPPSHPPCSLPQSTKTRGKLSHPPGPAQGDQELTAGHQTPRGPWQRQLMWETGPIMPRGYGSSFLGRTRNPLWAGLAERLSYVMTIITTVGTSEPTAPAAGLQAAELSSCSLTQALAPFKTSRGAARKLSQALLLLSRNPLYPAWGPSSPQIHSPPQAQQNRPPPASPPTPKPWRHSEASRGLGKIRGPSQRF